MTKKEEEDRKIIWVGVVMGFILLCVTLWLVFEAQKGWKDALDNQERTENKLDRCEKNLALITPTNTTVECISKYNSTICCNPGDSIREVSDVVFCFKPTEFSNFEVIGR